MAKGDAKKLAEALRDAYWAIKDDPNVAAAVKEEARKIAEDATGKALKAAIDEFKAATAEITSLNARVKAALLKLKTSSAGKHLKDAEALLAALLKF